MTTETLKSLLKTRFSGALLGGAAGDALGFPHHGSSRSYMVALGDEVVSSYQRHRSGYFELGQYSGATQMYLALVESIVEGGELELEGYADRLATYWRDNSIVSRDEVCSRAVQNYLEGAAWQEMGVSGDTSGCLSRAIPIGLWHHDNSERLRVEAERVCRLTHDDDRSVAATAALAAAIAYCVTHRELLLGEFVDALALACRPHCPALADTIARFPHYLSRPESETLETFTLLGWSELTEPEGVRGGAYSVLMVALYYFLRGPSQFEKSVGAGLLAGGDVEIIGCLVGSLVGALGGRRAVPMNLLEALPRRDRISRLAESFYGLKRDTRR